MSVAYYYCRIVIILLALWIALSGHSSQLLNEYCDSYELPFTGEHIDRHIQDDIQYEICLPFYDATFGADVTVTN